MDRAEWERRCAARYREIMTIDEEEAASLAHENADVEAAATGASDPGAWDPPEKAANDDMNQWGVS